MGDGLVLESGTHNELLSKDGPYARLVHAQKLKESYHEDVSEDDNGVSEIRAQDDLTLVRGKSFTSIDSGRLEKGKLDRDTEKTREFGFVYLFKRMGRLGKDLWKHYLLGALASCGTCVWALRRVSWLNNDFQSADLFTLSLVSSLQRVSKHFRSPQISRRGEMGIEQHSGCSSSILWPLSL